MTTRRRTSQEKAASPPGDTGRASDGVRASRGVDRHRTWGVAFFPSHPARRRPGPLRRYIFDHGEILLLAPDRDDNENPRQGSKGDQTVTHCVSRHILRDRDRISIGDQTVYFRQQREQGPVARQTSS